MITVMVCGASGKMGREVVKAVHADPELTLVGGVDHVNRGTDLGTVAGIEALGLPVYSGLSRALAEINPDVLVDFTSPAVVFENAKTTLTAGVHIVIGTTGLTAEQRDELAKIGAEHNANCLVAPNFPLGAVMMMKTAAEFGLTPKARSSVKINKQQQLDFLGADAAQEEENDPYAGFNIRSS